MFQIALIIAIVVGYLTLCCVLLKYFEVLSPPGIVYLALGIANVLCVLAIIVTAVREKITGP